MGWLELSQAADLFRQAVALDPSFAAAWASLASAIASSRIFAPALSPAAQAEMEGAFAQASRLAPNLPVVLRSRTVQALLRYDWADVDACLTALSAHGDAAFVGENTPGGAIVFLGIGRAHEALQRGYLERQANPLSRSVSFGLQIALDAAGRFDEAEAEYERSQDLPGEHGGAEWRAVVRMMALGDRAPVKRRLAGIDARFLPFLPEVVKAIGEPDKALETLRRAFEDAANQDGLRLGVIASCAAYLGDDAFALAALRRAFVDLRSFGLTEIWSPIFARLRRDPGFKDIVREVGLAGHWRRTGRWGDFARPVGEDDFEFL
jgi:tetratricopeptide (TPR) repeat protein